MDNVRSMLCMTLLWVVALVSAVQAQRGRVPTVNPPLAPQTQKPVMLNMHMEEYRITADIADCPLQTALLELAERTGIIFEVRGQENPLVSVHLNRVPLQEAIQRIASSSNIMFFYGQGPAAQEHITLVRVFPRTNPIPQPSIVYLGTGVVTKSNEDIETPEQALKALQEGSTVEAREKAIDVLVNSRSDAAIHALVHCMSDPGPEVRMAAIEGLAALGAHAALPGILKSLKDAHPGVRQSATTAVALLGNSQNIKDLKPLTADKDAGVAAAAELAIRKLSVVEKK